MKLKFLLPVYVMVCSCNENKISDNKPKLVLEQTTTFSKTNTSEIHKLYIKYIKENNIKQYNNISVDAILSGRMEDLLYYSMRMANKNNTPCAYYYIYYALSHPRGGVWMDKSDEKTKNIALYYLVKSYELGYKDAQADIFNIFGKNQKIENSSYYLMEYYK